MTTSTRFEIKSWDEKPYRELEHGVKFARADVVLAGTGDGFDAATWEAVLYYGPDGTSTFVGLMQVTGTIDGRTGSFAMHGTGSYDGTTARMRFEVVPGSGTGDLAGVTGTGEHASTHDDYPHFPLTLNIDLG
jgi:Protein of unknown function (DUF3224)